MESFNNSDCDMETQNRTSDYVIASFAIVFFILTVSFNLLLMVVIKSSRLLHTCTNAFVVSIAAGDFIHGAFKMPIVTLSKLAGRWPSDSSTCHVIAYLLSTGRTSSTLSLMMLSVDRCIAIYKPVRYASIITPFSTGSLITIIWICSSIFGSVPFWGVYSYDFDMDDSTCSFTRKSRKHHVISTAVLTTFIPMLVIIICIIIIINEARNRHRVFALAAIPIVLSNIQPKLPINPLRAMKSLFLIFLSYVIFCVPEIIVFIIKVYNIYCIPQILTDVKSAWSMMCCITTPVTITLCNRNYSKRLKHLIIKCCHRKNSVRVSDFSVSTGLHSILEASYTISNFRPIPNNIILHANESSRVHLRNSFHANPMSQSRTLFEKPMLRKALSSPDWY